jgi:hypothetical protein
MGSPKTPPSPTKKVKLVIFPGAQISTVTVREKDGSIGFRKFATGYIYVIGGGGESYSAMGGPPPGHGYKDVGGHTAEPTPPGHYILGAAEVVVTSSWPKSVIPWGAKLREENGEVLYQVGEKWNMATGRYGRVTQAWQQFWLRSGKPRSFDAADGHARAMFYDKNGKLFPEWFGNDFGPVSWCLKKRGQRTPFFIHTTPQNEIQLALHQPVVLTDSHGCVHITPTDRKDMVSKGYLKEGVEVEVRRYGEKGPP